MRFVAIARFRLLAMIRTATPLFLSMIVPLLIFSLVVSQPEPEFRLGADERLSINARMAILAWVLHALSLAFACLMSGKVKSPHDDVRTGLLHDLMDTAPVGPSARFWGEALGALAGTLTIHACCLPLLAAIAALNPLPTIVFLWIEGGAIALMVLAAAGAAWQRRAPRTKMSATRGPRNVIAFSILAILAILAAVHRDAFRDALATFMWMRTSMRGWADVAAAVDNPFLLIVLLSLLYAGTIAFYYVSSTRKRALEN